MVVLGIDPGTRVSGYVIFKKENRQVLLLDYGTLSLPASQVLPDRVANFFSFFKKKIEDFSVSDIAIETPFLGKNASNYLKLGYLRGAVYILTSHYNLMLHEYSPREVKLSVTGFGGADKEQVARMIIRLFPSLAMPAQYDLTDAFGVGICCIWSTKTLLR
ncbi:MAG: crossover junction endodeoxyribonuclease RuvC [Candidatus Babeliaceae bacterium]|nr:crossover junction endodeoxyribonuclease RuvC [Candidatus Babeliaceae bacterium]